MSSTIVYSALAAFSLTLTALAALGGGGAYIYVLFGGLLTFVLASFAYESYRLTDPVDPVR